MKAKKWLSSPRILTNCIEAYGSLAVLKRNSCDEILFAETYTNDKKISKSVHCAPNFGQNYSAFFRTEINNVNFFIKMKKILRPLFHFSLFLTFSGALYALSLNNMKYQLLISADTRGVVVMTLVCDARGPGIDSRQGLQDFCKKV